MSTIHTRPMSNANRTETVAAHYGTEPFEDIFTALITTPACGTCEEVGITHSDLVCCRCGRTTYWCTGHTTQAADR